MRIQKTSSLNDPKNTTSQDSMRSIDTDLTNVFQAINGKIRFGDGTSGQNGENISGQWVTFTTSTSNTEVVVNHTMGSIPKGFIVTNINVGGIIYKSSTAWTSSQIFIKCSAGTATVTMFLLR